MSAPLISCLMVTQAGRLPLFKRSVDDFLRQTHPKRELVIVTSSPAATMQPYRDWLNTLNDPAIRFKQLDSGAKQLPLGTMRNETNDLACGDYCCTWDDDDRHPANRLEVQLQAAVTGNASGSYINEQLYIFSKTKTMYLVNWGRGKTPGILLYPTTKIRYPAEKAIGEDAAFLKLLRQSGMTFVPTPTSELLYLRYCHGHNTWNHDHHYKIARRRSVGTAEFKSRQQQIIETLQLMQVPGPLMAMGRTGSVFTYKGFTRD